MRVTIICEDKDLEVVRKISKSFVISHETMNKPLSTDGNLPQTHWMCVCELSTELFNKLKKEAKYSKILTGNPKIILKDLNLKRIK